MSEQLTDSKVLAILHALDSERHASNPPEPEDMAAVPEYPEPDVVSDRFGSWQDGLISAGIVRDPNEPAPVPAHIKSRAKAVARHQCDECGADPTESRTGLAVKWADEPDDVSDATVGDVTVVCDECAG